MSMRRLYSVLAITVFAAAAGATKPSPSTGESEFVRAQLEKREQLLKSLSDEKRAYYLQRFDPQSSAALAAERAEHQRRRAQDDDGAEEKRERDERPVRDPRHQKAPPPGRGNGGSSP